MSTVQRYPAEDTGSILSDVEGHIMIPGRSSHDRAEYRSVDEGGTRLESNQRGKAPTLIHQFPIRSSHANDVRRSSRCYPYAYRVYVLRVRLIRMPLVFAYVRIRYQMSQCRNIRMLDCWHASCAVLTLACPNPWGAKLKYCYAVNVSPALILLLGAVLVVVLVVVLFLLRGAEHQECGTSRV